jgi:2-dehydro-3-deoxyphosphogluconate aldolase/(4S)-4-hydroxy-2-oxoglutarate aldolase
MDNIKVINAIEKHKVFGIARGIPVEYFSEAMEALYQAGIRLIEVTFDRVKGDQQTVECLKILQSEFSDKLIYGTGTVTECGQVETAQALGCHFIVSPDCNPEVIRKTKEVGMISIPGAMTATEAVIANRAGADFVKLFPGGLFGPDYFKALSAPLSDIKFIAVGGVDTNNIPAFYKAGAVGFGIGSSLIDNQKIINRNFDALSKDAQKFVQVCYSLGK